MAQHAASHLLELATAVLTRARTEAGNARVVAEALIAAEADGLASHGLSRLPAYADQALAGKVDGFARPMVERVAAACLRVDAATGFAYPAIRIGLQDLLPLARAQGLAALAIANSHHFGVAGHTVEPIAAAGLVGCIFGNSPAAIAPWGGSKPLFGTNPIGFAWPRRSVPPLVIDLSLSKVARGKIMIAAQKGDPIPEGWALDEAGQPTTDAKAALAGAMLPMGDAKGAALVLMVELLAVALTGSNFGYEASSFFDTKGAPPRVGQFLIAIDPNAFGGSHALERAEALFSAILAEPGTRLPGQRRLALRRRAEAYGISVPDALYAELERRAGLAQS
ncbi:MAG: Ldh family oxidoreductase [Proteobacteria bacterium]|nr:Ldh family oxidoreductase [Pseudomonadota bacterium]MBI3499093.1 Ldh family oxidoreductase [Pseudomonadota bacterium]